MRRLDSATPMFESVHCDIMLYFIGMYVINLNTDAFPHNNKNNATLNYFVFHTHKSMIDYWLLKTLNEVKNTRIILPQYD